MNWPISARRLVSASLFSTALLLVATGCEDASDLGVDLPGTTATNTAYRDFPVTASTVLQDSIATLKANSYLVGRIRDNALGTTTANSYFNLKLSPGVGDTLPSGVAGTTPNPQLDSVVLVMPYESVYGSAATPWRVNVYPLAASLDDQGLYNSSTAVVADAANPLGTAVTGRLNGTRKLRQRNDPNSTTDTTTFKVTVPDRTIRLKLPSSSFLNTTVFGLLKNSSFSQTQLDAAWKGLALQPATAFNTAVVGFSAVNSVTRVVFYYHYNKKVGTGQRNGLYSIPFGSQLAFNSNKLNTPRYFTNISVDPVAPFNQLQGAGGSSRSIPSGASNDVVYTQAGNGFSTKLEIPGLAELKQLAQPQAGGSGTPAIAINRAELLVPVQPYTNLLFTQPAGGYLYEINASNEPLKRTLLDSRVERLVLNDRVNQLGTGLTSVESYYQNAAVASFSPVSDVSSYYSMLLTGYTQAYVYDKLSGVTPAAFVLSPTLRNSGSLSLERAVFDGKNIKLRVYYSQLR